MNSVLENINLSFKSINLRLVEFNDAEFIVDLRKKKGVFLNTLDPDINSQIDWIKKYKEREANNCDFYYVIESKLGKKYGLIRIYNIDFNKLSFTWGSWILIDESPYNYAIESVLAIYFLAFFVLNLNICFFDVRNKNIKVIDFHTRFGAKLISQDHINVYFNYDKASFCKAVKKYHKYLSNKQKLFFQNVDF
jgi:hypothetical protein